MWPCLNRQTARQTISLGVVSSRASAATHRHTSRQRRPCGVPSILRETVRRMCRPILCLSSSCHAAQCRYQRRTVPQAGIPNIFHVRYSSTEETNIHTPYTRYAHTRTGKRAGDGMGQSGYPLAVPDWYCSGGGPSLLVLACHTTLFIARFKTAH